MADRPAEYYGLVEVPTHYASCRSHLCRCICVRYNRRHHPVSGGHWHRLVPGLSRPRSRCRGGRELYGHIPYHLHSYIDRLDKEDYHRALRLPLPTHITDDHVPYPGPG